jgi:integrase
MSGAGEGNRTCPTKNPRKRGTMRLLGYKLSYLFFGKCPTGALSMSSKKDPADPQDLYLYKRKNALNWEVRVKVPAELRSVLGPHLQASLKTRNKAEARRRKKAVLSKLFDRIETTAMTLRRDDDLLTDRQRKLMEFRKLVLGFNDSQEDQDPLRLVIHDELEGIAATGEEGRYVFDVKSVEFLPTFEEWAETQAQDKDTASRIRKVKRELTEFMGGQFFIGDVKPKTARAYLASVQGAKSTKKGRQQVLSRFWSHLVDEEQAANNPWKGIAITSDKGTERNVRPFEDYELAKLLKGLDSQPGHWRDLCVLALVTGARQEEIARLKDSDVFEHEGGYVLTMEKGKTDRMTKRIPVHHKSALPIIEKRSQLGGFLFPECKPTGEDQRRAKYFSKRFSEWKTKQGFGTELDFHSFRRYLANHFRKTVKDVHGVVPSAFLGHSIEDKDMTFGRYAGHVSVDELTPISEALRFPDGVEKALATLAVE